MSKRAKKALPYTVKDYMAHEMWIGGEKTTRGAFITEMLAAGHSRRNIDMYLSGHDLGEERRAKRAQEEWEKGVKMEELR